MIFSSKSDEYEFDNVKFNRDKFREFINDANEFIHHIFAGFDNKSKQWFRLDKDICKVQSMKNVRILPNVLFTNESTLLVVLKFLYSDKRYFWLFIVALIQEYERTYIVEFFPNLIVLYQLLINKPSEQNAVKFLVKLFTRKQGWIQILLKSKITERVTESVELYLQNDDKKNILKELVKLMSNNRDFIMKYDRYLPVLSALTIDNFQIGSTNEIYNWADVADLSISEADQGRSDRRVTLDIVINEDIFSSPTVLSLPMIDRTEAETIKFLLSAQLDLVRSHYCRSIKQQKFHLGSCVEFHWAVGNIYRAQLANRISIQILSSDDDTKGYSGENFCIKFVPLPAGNVNGHVCAKLLENIDDFKKFWNLLFKYQEWDHPHILKYFGLTKTSCGFFREYANGPVLFDVYNNSEDFLFKHIVDVLMSIGSALDYLHRNLNQTHGNVNLKSIVRVGDVFKLSEPSISETNSEIMECMETFNIKLKEGQKENELRDLLGLLFSILFMYFMNEELSEHKVSEDSFQKIKCSSEFRILILDSIKNQSSVIILLENLFKISKNFNDSIRNEIVVKKNNKYIPESLKVFSKGAQMLRFNEIKFSQLSISENIGEGHFSMVYKATYTYNNVVIPVAVKKLKNGAIMDLSKIKKELVPSLIDSHKNVLRSHGYCINNKDEIYLVSELGYSSLLSYLQKHPPNENVCVDYCKQICEGMRFLSDEKNFIHRDLAARNILVFLESANCVTLKISDFGLTLSLKRNTEYYRTPSVGNKFWLPHGDLSTGKFTLKTDIYSFGVLMWEIFTHGKQVKEHSANNPLPQIIDTLVIGDWAYEIMMSCLNEVEDKRPKNFESLFMLLNQHSL